MLLRFSATNYKSLYHTQELSMVAQSEQDGGSVNQSLTHETSGTGVVPYALIYGANASGKSNLIASLSFLRMAVIASHGAGGPASPVPRHHFLLKPHASEEPSELEIDFVIDGIRYAYGFKANDKKFTEEWLYVFPTKRPVRLFHRYEDMPINFGPSLKGKNKAIEQFVRHNSLFVSAAAQNSHPTLTKIYKYFLTFNFENMTNQGGFSMPHPADDSDSIDPRVVQFLNEVGVGVTAARLNRTRRSEDEIKQLAALLSAMKSANIEVKGKNKDIENVTAVELGHLSSDGTIVYFELDIESSGTRGLLKLMTSVFKILDSGGLLVVDEIDASVHTQVAEAILDLFANPNSNPNGAQLIATTHDTNLLCSDTIRRDQIWFAEKNELGETEIFPLTNFKPREGDNFQKGYLKGRFGAIPFSGNLSGLFKAEPVA